MANDNNSVEVIDTTKGKVMPKTNVNYTKPGTAPGTVAYPTNDGTSKNATYDPIFDTPPTFKVSGANDEIQSLDELMETPRTPIMKGTPTPVTHTKETEKEEVPDPTPLKVVNNVAAKFGEGELTPFDVNSLPPRKEEPTEADNEAMSNLSAAVERECKSITERIQALTAKQYDEMIEARQAGKEVARPISDEEAEAIERAEIEKKEEETEEELVIPKKIIIAGSPETEIKEDLRKKEEKFASECMEAVEYVSTHVTAKDYFSRVLHCRNKLSELNIFSEIYAFVMYNDEGEVAVHPFLSAERDGITVVIEVNIDHIAGIHILEANDTIEGVYTNFLHKGALYEYIDYLKKSSCVKLSPNNPTAEAAVKLAEAKQLKGDKMEPRENDMEMSSEMAAREKELDAELEAAINPEEAKDLYSETTEEEFPTTVILPKEEEEEAQTIIDEKTVPMEVTKEKITIERGYEGEAAFEGAPDISDIESDLNKELHIDTQRSDEDILEDLKSAVKSNIPSIKRKINLSNFKIDETPISAAQVAGFSIKDINEADWVLPNAKRMITVRGLSGPELFAMNPQNSNKNKINTFRQIYGIIYKHIVSKKPKSFDDWLKVTRFSDIDHIYAALHKATFAGSNFVHYECPECNHIFIQDYDFEEMVKYANDEAKAKIAGILNAADSSIAGYDVQLSQISDNYVVGLKDPSIWNMVMETAALSDSFLTKYEDLLDTMSFIDSIYVIDESTQTLKPVDFGYDADNPAKSTARKITILSDIIRSLSSDNYFELRTEIAKLFASSEDVTYRIPEAVCPKCGHKFEAEDTGAMQLLFTRHQLGALGAM